MSAPQSARAVPASVSVARLTMEAVRTAEVCRAAIFAAMSYANEHSVVVPGWPLLQEVDAYLARLVDPHGTVRALAENELRATGETP